MNLRAADLFAGLGGFSEGAHQAGARVVWAGNHWYAAVSTHERNHPDTVHACQDMHQQDWTLLPPFDILLASPACQGHSRARGKEQKHHDATRATAFAICGALDWHRPRYVLVENVTEFRDTWDGYEGWRKVLECFGYAITENVLEAADFGVPQNRERLFILGVRNGDPIKLRSPGLPHRSAAEVVDFRAGRWTPVYKSGRSPQTLGRIEQGRRDGLGERFLVPYYKSAKTGRCLSRPVGTLTCKDRYGVVDGDRYRMLTPQEVREAMGFPAGYRLPGPCRAFPTRRFPQGERLSARAAAVWMLGNAVCPPVARELVRQIQAAS